MVHGKQIVNVTGLTSVNGAAFDLRAEVDNQGAVAQCQAGDGAILSTTVAP